MTPSDVPPPGSVPPGWKCPKRIGFLFPHQCTRLTPVGCPDCQGGQVDDPYARRARYSYTDYDYYDDSLTFFAIDSASHLEHHYEFTEADGESLVTPDDSFEDDMSAS